MNRLISLKPSNLVAVRVEPGKKCSGELTLRNVMYTMPVAFRLQAVSKTRYTIRPQSGIISPLATLTVEITYSLLPGASFPDTFPHSDDGFLLHSVVVPGAAVKDPTSTFDTILNDWFTTKKKQVFIDSGIKVMFVGSPILSHLVSEIREVLEKCDPMWRLRIRLMRMARRCSLEAVSYCWLGELTPSRKSIIDNVYHGYKKNYIPAGQTQ